MQTIKMSFVEQIMNTGSGFIVSLLVWTYFIVPVWNLPVDFHQNVVITLIFTVVSICRGYLWRRLFNWFTYRSA